MTDAEKTWSQQRPTSQLQRAEDYLRQRYVNGELRRIQLEWQTRGLVMEWRTLLNYFHRFSEESRSVVRWRPWGWA